MIDKLKDLTKTKSFHICMIMVIIVVILFVVGLLVLRYNVEGETRLPFNLTGISVISTTEGTDLENSVHKWDLNVNQNKNIKNLEILLDNLAQLSTTLNKDSKTLNHNIANTSLKLGEMAENVSLSAKGFNASLKDIQEGALALSSFAKKANVKLDSYDDLRLSLAENLELLKKVLIESNILIQNLQKSPSDLIFKETKPKLGPGEKQ